MPLTLSVRNALEARFDQRIPAHLLETRTNPEMQADHHRAMIRFAEGRIADFSQSLEKLEAAVDFPARAAWIDRTKATIADHQAELAHHEAALDALVSAAAVAEE